MKGETNREVERNPGQVEQRDRTETGEIGTDGVEVAQRLHAFTAAARPHRQAHQQFVDAAADRLVERATDARKDPPADAVEDAERSE